MEPFAADTIQQDLPERVSRFDLDGCCIVEGAIPVSHCEVLTDFVDAELFEARRHVAESGFDEAKYTGEVFGKLRCREQRWDLKLPLQGPVMAAMSCVGQSLGSFLVELVGEDAMLTELSSIVSDPGAQQQPLHADTMLLHPGMMSILIALQPITPAMGPTVICPRTVGFAGSGLLQKLKPEGADETTAVISGYQDHVIDALGGVHVSCEAGTAVLYDSRLIHCGGANLLGCEGGARRRLLVATFVDLRRRSTPRGSACTIRKELRGRIRLRTFLKAAVDHRPEWCGTSEPERERTDAEDSDSNGNEVYDLF